MLHIKIIELYIKKETYVALTTISNHIIDLVDDEPNQKSVVKRGSDQNR